MSSLPTESTNPVKSDARALFDSRLHASRLYDELWKVQFDKEKAIVFLMDRLEKIYKLGVKCRSRSRYRDVNIED